MSIAVEFYKRHGKTPARYLVHEFRDNSVLRTIMKLPPREQLKTLQKRGKNLVLTTKWNELSSGSHDKAFTVAKVMSADLLQDIYNHVEQAKRDGWTLDEFRKNLLPKLESAGWVGANPSRLKVIYETNMQVAYAKERYKQHKLVSDEYPYWRYEQVERETKNHDHSKYHNKIFRHDDPIWSSIYPPSEYGCKCTVTPMSEDDVQGMTISKGTDFKDIEPPNLDLLKAWEPKTDKYVSGIKKQLESILSINKSVDVETDYPPLSTKWELQTTRLYHFLKDVNIDIQKNPLLMKERQDYWDSLDYPTLEAVRKYTGNAYDVINTDLRKNVRNVTYELMHSGDLDYKLKSDFVLARGEAYDDRSTFIKRTNDFLNRNAFTCLFSTTLDNTTADYFAKLDKDVLYRIYYKINAKSGVASGWGNLGESEIIFDKTCKYNIKNVEYYKAPYTGEETIMIEIDVYN